MFSEQIEVYQCRRKFDATVSTPAAVHTYRKICRDGLAVASCPFHPVITFISRVDVTFELDLVDNRV